MNKKCEVCGSENTEINYSNLMEQATKTCNECGYVQTKEE